MLQKIVFGISVIISSVLLPSFFIYQKSLSAQIPKSSSAQVAQKRLEELEKSEKFTTTAEEIQQITVVEAKTTALNTDYTVQLTHDSTTSTIHLIGIKPPTQAQQIIFEKCFDKKLTTYLEEMLLDQPLFLITDASLPDTEDLEQRYRYAFTDEALFLNRDLLQKGLAVLDTNMFYNTLYHKELQEDQKIAQEKKIGIWSESCPLKISPTLTLTPTNIPTKIQKPTATPLKLHSAPTTKPVEKPTSIPTPTLKSSTKIALETPNMSLNSITLIPTPKNSLNADLLFALINIHRKGKNLQAFEKDEQLCRLASSRAPELHDEIFVTGKVHQGLYDRNIPYWITENMAHYDSEEDILKWWLGSTLHRNAIEGTARYSCGACSGNSCAQLFTNYTPK